MDDKERLEMFCVWIGFAIALARGKPKISYQYLSKALELGEEIGNQQVIGYACTWLNWTCSDWGLLDEAVAFGEKAQEISGILKSEGVNSKSPNCNVKKLYLIDHGIQFCKNCLVCRDSKTNDPVAKCSIREDMDYIREDVLKSDSLIFGTPVHVGYATAIMMTFPERICWTFAKPERKALSIYGCPIP